ncbi:SfnB family sulfur acquisition oxidoreductase [Caldovatus sediminis]|uniref:SfnB family sulfur acquisition oxidoreductase n=1 Tax=Caldovatus sediminis TaxID=2041189 RepID=A0A8J3EAA8_9PROT|nr:acyl-CoA dehydrogenase family protein [Caldovatus sediminis]GGG24187.1 SfnB family sulfur acquisition oxidoreductase [Caldovatus sediminis]
MTSSLDLQALVDVLGPRFAEGAAERDAGDVFVAGHYDVLKQHKVFSALVPTELGGGGARHGDMCAFLRRLAHFCPSTALALSMHQHLVAAAVYNDRNDRPGRALLGRVVADEVVLVSTGANDWMESNGTVERAEGGFRVSARKPFCSGAPAGGILVTSAPFEDPAEGWQVLHFPVPFSAPGISLADDWHTLGMRATGSQTVILDGVFVPDAAIVLRRPRGRFHPAWNVILTVAMPLIMSVYVGVAEAAARIAGEQAKRRQGDPTVPYLLGELGNHLTMAQLAWDDMVRLARDLDFAMSLDLTSAILTRKTIAAEHILATAEKALEVAGGAGFYRGIGLERLLRDAQGARFHPLSAKHQHRFTGRVALGLDPIADTA